MILSLHNAIWYRIYVKHYNHITVISYTKADQNDASHRRIPCYIKELLSKSNYEDISLFRRISDDQHNYLHPLLHDYLEDSPTALHLRVRFTIYTKSRFRFLLLSSPTIPAWCLILSDAKTCSINIVSHHDRTIPPHSHRSSQTPKER